MHGSRNFKIFNSNPSQVSPQKEVQKTVQTVAAAVVPTVPTVPVVPAKSQPVIKKQKLSDKWVLWSHHINNQNWDLSSYSKICTIEYEEDFKWLVSNFPTLDEYILYLMRDGIAPIWEDPRNRNGGCFSYKLKKKFYSDIWTDFCRSLIYDYLTDDVNIAETITGLSINPRTYTIKIWNNDKRLSNPKSINPPTKFIDNNYECIYKPHQVDTRRIDNKDYSIEGEKTENSDEQKITILLTKISNLMSKLVKSNLSEFSIKLKKMEELMGQDLMVKVFERYDFINPENENDYIFAKLKLKLIYILSNRVQIYKSILAKMLARYWEIMKSTDAGLDMTPQNIGELEEEGKLDEIDENIRCTNLRNEMRAICVYLYYVVNVNLLGNESYDFWTDLIRNSLEKGKYNPYLIYDGLYRLLIMIKVKFDKDELVKLLTDFNSGKVPRKIKFMTEDVIKFIDTNEKNKTVIELHEVFE